MTLIINRYLYLKYSESQDYYYKRDINFIFTGYRSKYNIDFIDQITFDDN